MSLAEDHSIEGGRELEGDDHPRLLAGHVQPRDLRHVGRLLPLLTQRLNLPTGDLERDKSEDWLGQEWLYLCVVEEK